MKFQHLLHDNCPECGAVVKDMQMKNQHCNGHWNEYKRFDCGRQEHFSPNFMAVSTTAMCERSKQYKEDSLKEDMLLKSLRQKIEKSDAPEKFRKRLLEALKYF